MKRKKSLIVIMALIAVAICTVTFSVAFATAILTLEYDYYTEAALPAISYNESTHVIKSEGEVKVTVCDIIYNDGGKLKVHKDVALPDEGYTCTDDIVRILPVKTVYEDVTVNYLNEYVESFKDIVKTNTHKAYNNVFEYVVDGVTKQSKSRISRTLVFLSDVTIPQDYTLNYPCSIELLTSKLTLQGNLTVEHSSAGVYYIRNDLTEEGTPVSGIVAVDENQILIKAPNAKYVCDDVLASSVNGNAFSSSEILTEALDFAEAQIPSYPTRNLYLQTAYKTYGVTLKYELKDKPAEGETLAESGPLFYGDIAPHVGTEKVITITASCGAVTQSRDVEISVVNFADGTFVIEGLSDMIERYYYLNYKKQVTRFDFATVIKEFFGSSIPSGKYLNIFVADDSLLSEGDENLVSLETSDANVYSLTLSGDINSLVLAVDKGNITISDNIFLYLVYGTDSSVEKPEDPSLTLTVQKADYDEIIYYLKGLTPAFITNNEYGVLHVESGNIYAGKQVISENKLDIKSISGAFTGFDKSTDPITTLTDGDIKELYFGEMSADYTYKLKSKTVMLSAAHDVKFVYTVTFEDNTVKQFAIPVYRTALGAGGESEMFTSDNQLAAYFINEDISWLAPYDLVLTQDYYTQIEVTDINGTPISSILPSNPIKKIISLEGVGTARKDEYTMDKTDENFYQTYKLLVNPNYVPAENTTITVHCYLYNAGSESTNKINEYAYTFVIPGIFKCRNNGYANVTNWPDYDADLITDYTFNDSSFYKLITELLGGKYTSLVYSAKGGATTEPVILSSAGGYEGNAKISPDFVKTGTSTTYDGRGNAGYIKEADAAYTAIDFSVVECDAIIKNGVKTIQNVDGIQVFSRVHAVVLDGIHVEDNVYAFGEYSGLTLKYISMKGCGLQDSCIYNPARSGKSALSNLYITAINLADNNIRTIDGLLMRTVHTFDISNNEITDISAVSGLKDLTWLDVSDNSIMRFEPLKQLNSLKTVFVSGNLTTNTVYGTYGCINIPVYVWIMKTSGVSVFAGSADKTSAISCGNGEIFGYSLTDEEIEGSVALNAFASPLKMNSTEKTRLETNLSGAIGDYTFKFISKTGAEGVSVSLYTDDDSAIENGTVCYYKIAIYREGTILVQREFCVTFSTTA